MKFNFLLFTILGVLLLACSVESPENPLAVYRNIAYMALHSLQKSSILGDWEKAEVSAWTNGNYLVVFPTKNNKTIRVIVDPNLGSVVEILS